MKYTNPGSAGWIGWGLTLAMGVGAMADVAPTGWKENLYNPKAAPGDLILPMPCGGAMAFRPIGTQTDGPLADTSVEVGGDTEAQGYVEHRYQAHLAGGFQTGEDGRPTLLMGKYEVTTAQYDAVMDSAGGAPCSAPGSQGRLPKTGLGWHGAVAFAHQFSLWLRAHAGEIPACADGDAPCLPRIDGEPAFARLPTEVEWEYAARGGEQVGPAQFREPLYPMADGLERHVWFNETARGQVRPIGVLAPNPLGLHDMIGNVEEVALDPFRLHRLDRPHGQAGGYVVRGGSVHSNRDELRASLRREVPFYDDQGAVGTTDTGFRLLLSAPVLTSNDRLLAVRAAWERLGSDSAKPEAVPPTRPDLHGQPFADPVLELTALARASADPVLKGRLDRLRGLVAGAAERLYEQRARGARESLRFGGVLCQKVADEGLNLDLMRERQKACEANSGAGHARCSKLGDALARDLAISQHNVEFYGDTIVRTAQTYPQDLAVLHAELTGLRQEFADRGYGVLGVYPQQFHDQVVGYAASGKVTLDTWLGDCKALNESAR